MRPRATCWPAAWALLGTVGALLLGAPRLGPRLRALVQACFSGGELAAEAALREAGAVLLDGLGGLLLAALGAVLVGGALRLRLVPPGVRSAGRPRGAGFPLLVLAGLVLAPGWLALLSQPAMGPGPALGLLRGVMACGLIAAALAAVRELAAERSGLRPPPGAAR